MRCGTRLVMPAPGGHSATFPAALAAILSGQVYAGALHYRIIDLTEIARKHGVQQSEARGINYSGQIVGFEVLGDFKEQAILWNPDGSVFILPRIDGDNSNLAVTVHDDGTVLGLSEEVIIEKQGHQQRIFEHQKATLWIDFQAVNLNDLWSGGGGDTILRFATDKNDTGQIVGYARQGAEPPFTLLGFLFEDGEVTFTGHVHRASAVNNPGQVVGWSVVGQANAWLWDDGVETDLHDHPDIQGVTSRAFDINDSTWIVGEAQFHISKPEEATLWRNGEPVRLVPEFNRPQGVATAVNNFGQIVGYFNDLDNTNDPFRGFIWESGEWTELLDLLEENPGWQVLFPFAINDRGQIVGGGLRNNRPGHAFLMTGVGRAFLIGAEIITGTHLGGDVTDLRESDDSVLHARSGFGETLAELHMTELHVFGSIDEVRDPTTLDITIESRIDEPAGTGVILLRNWSTFEFDRIASFSVTDVDERATVEGIDAADYVREADVTEFELIVKHIVFVPFLAFSFESFFDEIEILAIQ